MAKLAQPSQPTTRDGLEPVPNRAEDNADDAPRAARKPYQRPVVQKRRSVSQATLIGTGGVGGALVGGSG
jgi:hypothetical protein